jgi:hypothetical protein
VVAEEHVPEHEHAIALAPEGDVAGRMPRRLDHREPAHIVTLTEAAIDRMGRPCPVAQLPPRDPPVRNEGRKRARFHAVRLTGRAQQRDLKRLADAMTRPLVVSVRMRDRM